MRVAVHYYGCEPFEVEAHTQERFDELIKAECHDRGWLVEEVEVEELE